MDAVTKKLVKISYVFMLVSVFLSVVSFPEWIRYRNPPYHRYGGFDLLRWYGGLVVYCIELGLMFVFARKGYGNRYVTLAAITTLVVTIIGMLVVFMLARQAPPI